MYICIYAYIYVYMYMYIYIDIHICIYTWKGTESIVHSLLLGTPENKPPCEQKMFWSMG